jgi:hypothetical protein
MGGAYCQAALDPVIFHGKPDLAHGKTQLPGVAEDQQNQGYGLVRVVGLIFQEEEYGITLPTGSALREPIHAALCA